MEGIPVYSGALPETVAREFEFQGVYQVKVTKKDKTFFSREEYDHSKKVEQLYDNMKAQALELAIKKFSSDSKIVPSGNLVEVLADVHIVSERKIEWFDSDILCEHDQPSPKLEILVEAIGYRKR